jgi:hypothetical protein
MSSDTPPDPPTRVDALLTVLKAVASVNPVTGVGAGLLGLIRVPATKRQHAFVGQLALRLTALEGEKRLRVEDVVQSDAFVSATIRGIDAARRTAEQEKIDALRSGILNVALGSRWTSR